MKRLLFSLILTFSACGSDDTPKQLEEVCERVSYAVCPRIAACSGEVRSDCVSVSRNVCCEMAGRCGQEVSTTEAELVRCTDDISIMSCDVINAGNLPTSCERI